MTKLAGMLYI